MLFRPVYHPRLWMNSAMGGYEFALCHSSDVLRGEYRGLRGSICVEISEMRLLTMAIRSSMRNSGIEESQQLKS